MLADCAPEALACITSPLNAYELAALWFCGDSQLNWKLSKARGVTNFHFEFHPTRKPLWPNLISSFEGMTDLSIHYARHTGFIQADLLLVPHSIRNLVLDFPFEFSFFQCALRHEPARFRNLETVKCPKQSFVPDMALENPLNLRTLSNAPNLTTLVLPRRIAPIDMEELPRSITSLSFQCPTPINFDAEHLKNLFSLDATFQGHTDDFWHLLPDTLTHLSTKFSGVTSRVHLWNWNSLPKRLKSFSVHSRGLSETLAKLLPVTLESFQIGEVFDDFFKMMPPKLTHLVADCDESISTELAAAFPRSLRGSLIPSVVWNATPFLPHGITDINVWVPNDSNRDLHLPPQIKRLTLNEGMPQGWLRLLSPNLESLSIIALFGPIGVSPIDWQLLPRSLTVFNASDDEILIAHDESSAWLPRSLTSLSIGVISMTSTKWFSNLPTSLTKLNLEVEELPLESDHVLAASFPHIQHLSIKARKATGVQAVDLLQHLPRKLLVFSFSNSAQTVISGKDLLRLPPGLIELSLPSCLIEEQWLWKSNPQALVSLLIQGRPPEWQHFLADRRKQSLAQLYQYLKNRSKYLGIDDGESPFAEVQAT
jgi:hypothetical protein